MSILRALRAVYRQARQAGIPDEITHGYLRFGPDGMTPAARQARAAELFPQEWYHATGADIRLIDPAARGTNTDVGAAKEAFWAAATPEGAEGYAEMIARRGGSPNMIAGRGRMENPRIIEGGGQPIYDAVPNRAFSAVLRDAREAGHDGVVFRQVRDAPGRIEDAPINDVFAYFDPSASRSINATFDPARRRWRNLLAGVGGGGLLGALALRPSSDQT